MHNYHRNHQLYLAERCLWIDRHVNKTSNRALMKVTALKLAVSNGEPVNNISRIMDFVCQSLLSPVPASAILQKEGYYLSHVEN